MRAILFFLSFFLCRDLLYAVLRLVFVPSVQVFFSLFNFNVRFAKRFFFLEFRLGKNRMLADTIASRREDFSDEKLNLRDDAKGKKTF